MGITVPHITLTGPHITLYRARTVPHITLRGPHITLYRPTNSRNRNRRQHFCNNCPVCGMRDLCQRWHLCLYILISGDVRLMCGDVRWCAVWCAVMCGFQALPLTGGMRYLPEPCKKIKDAVCFSNALDIIGGFIWDAATRLTVAFAIVIRMVERSIFISWVISTQDSALAFCKQCHAPLCSNWISDGPFW